jgi:hypothetical protein
MNSDHLVDVLREQVLSGMADSDHGEKVPGLVNVEVHFMEQAVDPVPLTSYLGACLASPPTSTIEAAASVGIQTKRWVIGRYLARAEAETLLLPGCLTCGSVPGSRGHGGSEVLNIDPDAFSVSVTWQSYPHLPVAMEVVQGALGPALPADRILLDRLDEQELRTRHANWDFENGLAIPASEWRAARRLCEAVALAVAEAPVPVPAPCGDGTVHLRWSKGQTDVVIELKDQRAWWTRKDPGSRRDGEFSDPLQAIALIRETFA